jgi:hypothetical protein
LNVSLWVATVGGEPRPRWSDLRLTANSTTTGREVSPTGVELHDLDGDGRVSEGDVLFLRGLDERLLDERGEIILWSDGLAIATSKVSE